MLKFALVFSFVLIFTLGFYWHEYSFPFNQVKCGNGTYVLFQDIENPYYMYNINNSKMFWKAGIWAKSIQYAEERNNIKTELHIYKNRKTKESDFNADFRISQKEN